MSRAGRARGSIEQRPRLGRCVERTRTSDRRRRDAAREVARRRADETRCRHLFGGTFDPVHIASSARCARGVGNSRCARAPDAGEHSRRTGPACRESRSSARRCSNCAMAGQKRLSVDARELRRGGSSYTLDTLDRIAAGISARAIRSRCCSATTRSPDCRRGIGGAKLFALAHFVVMTRPGHDTTLSADLATEIAARRTDAAADLKHGAAGKGDPLGGHATGDFRQRYPPSPGARPRRALAGAGRLAGQALDAGAVPFSKPMNSCVFATGASRKSSYTEIDGP